MTESGNHEYEQMLARIMADAVASALKAVQTEQEQENFFDLADANGTLPREYGYLSYSGYNNGPITLSISGYLMTLVYGSEIRLPMRGGYIQIVEGTLLDNMIYATMNRVIQEMPTTSSNWETYDATIGTTPIQLENIPCQEVLFQASPANTGTITISSSNNPTIGMVLSAGATQNVEIGNVNAFYAVASASGQVLNIGVRV